MGNIIVVLRRKWEGVTVLPNVNVRDFIAAEMLLLKERYTDWGEWHCYTDKDKKTKKNYSNN